MNQATAKPLDILMVEPETSRLKNVGTAWPTPRGTGFRFTLKTSLPEGAQIVLLPSKRPSKPATQPAEADA